MSYKFEIREDNYLVVRDTDIVNVVDNVMLDIPKNDVYYDISELKKGNIFIYDKDSVNIKSSGVFQQTLSSCLDENSVVFTKETFIDWVYAQKLGFNLASGSGAGGVLSNQKLLKWQDPASDAEINTYTHTDSAMYSIDSTGSPGASPNTAIITIKVPFGNKNSMIIRDSAKRLQK